MARPSGYGERLAAWGRGLPPVYVDAAIAILCALYVMFDAGVEQRFAWWVPLGAAANSLPLMWRRQYPFAVAGITGITTTVLSMAGGLNDVPAAQLVATYTFAALSPPVKRLIGVAATAVGISVSILLPDDEALNLGVIGIFFAGAYALGVSARARGDRITLLEERALRLTKEQETAATRERERIAREMHDILAHSMTLVVVQAEAGPVAVRHDPDRAEQMFDTISVTAREALAQLRRVLGVLRTESDAAGGDRSPLPGLDALPDLVRRVEGTGLTATLTEDGDPRPVPADVAATAYRIVQESLTNTVKHAAAGRVDVRLSWTDDHLSIEVADDGAGPPSAPPTPSANGSGHGLIGMRERVLAAGGTLDAGPGPGRGFRVVASLRLD
ncbi:sensor histidine kinase [Jiangella alkaliphila]|uniref:histidine kinase n=1 Tax=Jiangella alkaliphila TaxID=419479 RepID=A0A1H2HQV2_9ACTN|nr:sensor histidine kinase [Jiangella alkaliphila]SDU34273.1 Signal transduction histidine kinase [Jiangella alkaliphila]